MALLDVRHERSARLLRVAPLLLRPPRVPRCSVVGAA